MVQLTGLQLLNSLGYCCISFSNKICNNLEVTLTPLTFETFNQGCHIFPPKILNSVFSWGYLVSKSTLVV
jgi:hypothetical protein